MEGGEQVAVKLINHGIRRSLDESFDIEKGDFEA